MKRIVTLIGMFSILFFSTTVFSGEKKLPVIKEFTFKTVEIKNAKGVYEDVDVSSWSTNIQVLSKKKGWYEIPSPEGIVWVHKSSVRADDYKAPEKCSGIVIASDATTHGGRAAGESSCKK